MKFASGNEFIQGTMAGAIGAIVICFVMELLELIGIAKHCWLFMAGQAVMEFKHNNFLAVTLAFLIHLGVGSFWGVIIAFLFSKVFMAKYYLLKSAIFGMAIFFLHIGLLSKALHYPDAMRENLPTVFFILITYIMYGLLTAIILKKITRIIVG